ncbi:MAG: RDD family protein [Gammaproteobacteria bacterium]|nr:RDD family protein [Gammaproteobacteria bacterium]
MMSPGLFRRLASGFYDALIMVAICMLATLIIVPFAPGRDLHAFYADQATVKLVYQLGLLALGFAFFGGFWIHGGQTIGMRAWKLRVVCMDGRPLGWHRALVRYLCMLIPWLLLLLGCEFLIGAGGHPQAGIYSSMGIGILMLSCLAFVWPAIDLQRLAWHDRLSSTRLIALPSSHDH